MEAVGVQSACFFLCSRRTQFPFTRLTYRAGGPLPCTVHIAWLQKTKTFNEQIMINKQQQQQNYQLDKREDILKYSAYVQRINFHFTFSLLFLREINSSQMSRVRCFKPSRILTAGIVSVSMAISYPCSLVAACLGITLRQTWVTLPLRESSIMPIHTYMPLQTISCKRSERPTPAIHKKTFSDFLFCLVFTDRWCTADQKCCIGALLL